jgi:hypothetical protein
LYYECSISGDNQYQPFAVLMLTRRQTKFVPDGVVSTIDQRKSSELLKIPFRADLIILPYNFVELIALLRVREKIEKQSNKDIYLKAWIQLLEKYMNNIPSYYHPYLLRYLLSMNYTEVKTLRKLNHKVLDKKIEDQIRRIKEEQNGLCFDRDSVYLFNLKHHKNLVFGDFPD